MLTHERTEGFQAALLKEMNAIADFGGCTHLHTLAECAEILKTPIAELKQIPTGLVWEYRFKDNVKDMEHAFEKARMYIDGSPRFMQKGVHYEESYAHTPKQETSRLLSALAVLLGLQRHAFDIANAYC